MVKGWPSNALSLGNKLQGESGCSSWLPALSYLIHTLPADRMRIEGQGKAVAMDPGRG